MSPGERYGYVYEINFLRCIHCDLCVEACPTEAITESKLMEFSFTNRNDAIYTKEELLVDDDGKPKHLPWEDWREDDDLHTSGWMRATSPSGSAEFEGRVQWSGELGFGVRSPESGQTGTGTTPPPAASSCVTPSSATCSRATCLPAKRGPRGAIGRMMEKAERFAPGCRQEAPGEGGRRLRRAVMDGNVERDTTAAAPAHRRAGGRRRSTPMRARPWRRSERC